MYRNFTYSYGSDKRYLRCSKYASLRCSARLIVNPEGYVLRANSSHNHPAPVFFRANNGIYYEG